MTPRDKRRKLTAEQVEEIRKLRADGRTFKSLAQQFHISIAQTFKIIDGSAWKK